MRLSALLSLGVFLTLLVVSQADYVRRKPCTMGPIYWCSQLSTAVECNAVERCVPIWKRRPVTHKRIHLNTERPNVLCRMSEIALLSVKSSLRDAKSMESVYSFTPKACANLVRMEPKFAPLCRDITQRHLRPITVLLKHNVSVSVIADLLNHCNSKVQVPQPKPRQKLNLRHIPKSIPAARTFVPTQPRKTERKMKNSIECSMCVRVMNYIDTILEKNSTEQEIAQTLETVCQFLPGTVKESCIAIIEDYTPTLIRLFVDEFPPAEICQALNMCPKKLASYHPRHKKNTVQPLIHHPRQSKNDIECSVCVRVINYVESFITANSTVEDIESALEVVCNFVPVYREECQSLVKEYTPALVQLILAEFPPVQICQVLGMCPTAANKFKRMHSPKPVKKPNSIECTFCVNVMNYLDSILESNSTQQEIERALETVCNFLPSSVSSECDALIEQYFPILVELILAEFTPQETCQALGLCTALAKRHSVSLKPQPKLPLKSRKAALGSIQCTVCVQVFNYVESFLKDNKTEERVVEALEKVCSFLPSSVQDECDSIIDLYTPVLIELIVNEFTPQEICQSLGICDAARKGFSKRIKHTFPFIPARHFNKPHPRQKLVGRKQVKDIQCEICVHAMEVVESYLEKNSTEQQIENAIKRACSYLPRESADQCNAIVDAYLPILINLIVSEFTPNQICQAIYMCPQAQYQGKGYSSRLVWPDMRPHVSAMCNQGPRYWCKTVETAKACGIHAMLVCSRKYWNQQH